MNWKFWSPTQKIIITEWKERLQTLIYDNPLLLTLIHRKRKEI